MNTETETINLLDLARQAEHPSQLELIRLDNDELPVIPFTVDVLRVNVHYCREDEIKGYVRCNEPNCVLCKIGRNPDERLLLPVYLPTVKTVSILPITPAMRPFALLPQLLEILQKEDFPVIFIRRENMTRFTVTTSPLAEGMDAGETHIKAFLETMESGAVDLKSVYNRLGNNQLMAVPSIADTLRLKGIDPLDLG